MNTTEMPHVLFDGIHTKTQNNVVLLCAIIIVNIACFQGRFMTVCTINILLIMNHKLVVVSKFTRDLLA